MATGHQFDLPYSVEQWDDDDKYVEELIALTGDDRVARAAFEEAVKRRPGRIVTLRRKTRLLATTESHRPSHNPAMMRVNRGGNAMDAKARAFVLMKLRPMLEAFKEAVVEERANGASDAKIEAMIEYALETNSKHLDPDVLKARVVELREIARSTHQGPATVQ